MRVTTQEYIALLDQIEALNKKITRLEIALKAQRNPYADYLRASCLKDYEPD